MAEPDLIVINGKLVTMADPPQPATALAIAGGRILAVGATAEIRALAGLRTRIVDAAGASVLPGFVESHMHLFAGAAELDHLQLHGVVGRDAMAKAIRDFAGRHPARPVLLAQGADYDILSERSRVTRHDLDRAIRDRPFAMAAADHHTMWANTLALERAGLLAGRTLARGHEIVIGPDGLATGELREIDAFSPILRLAGLGRESAGLVTGGEPDPQPTAAERAADRELLKRGLAWCARHGITSIHNMDGNLYTLALLEDIEDEDALICRVRVPFHMKSFMPLAALEKARAMAGRYRSDTLSSGFVKVFYDGVLESWTAAMIEDYADKPGTCGVPLFTPEHFAEVAVAADRLGLQIAVHAIGDAAVRAVLDGYQAAAAANGRRDSRHRIEHIEVIHPADIPRFRALGVVASMQPRHAPGTMGLPLEPTVSRIGVRRWPWSYAWRTLRESGARLVFATDWPVSPIDPLASIQAALTRPRWSSDLPDQRQSLDQALRSYTADGAYAEFKEDRKGVLRRGALADVVVLSGDIAATPPEQVSELTVATTICNGRVTYQMGTSE
ncbi:MAG TPA: amidohydrolase [Aestuariivirgaceae bacterium]|nr:amidohydrolase [Aestuariivirgaceae bacterium]